MFAVKLTAIAVMATSPISLTIAPAKLAAKPHSEYTVRVYDSGKTPLSIEMKLAEIRRIHGVCREMAAPKWASASPGTFALRAGHSRAVAVRIGDTGSPGSHDLATLAVTTLGHRGNVRVNGAAGSQALVRFPGHVSKDAPKPCLSLSATHSGISAVLLLALWIGAALAGGAILLFYWLWFRHGRGSHRAVRGMK